MTFFVRSNHVLRSTMNICDNAWNDSNNKEC